MGVPKFFRWISERYPCLSELVKEYQIPEFDNLYLDMNGIIHMCSHPNDFDPHFRITEEKIFKDIFHYIEVLFRMIQPKKLFFMAVDGVAPRAKMNQQRGRRFRSAKEAEILEQKARERGEALPSEARFDSNCITPGTDFMAKLQEQLKYFVTFKLSSDPQWRGVKIILSGHETPGEGEHKIMDYIRYMKAQPGYDANTRHCLYGLDADLIMLGLCSHEPHFSLLREEVKYGRKAKQTRTSTPEETKFFLLHLSLMREYLELEFSALKSVLPFPFDVEKIIDDWVLMGFLVGNDFIPPLPDMHIINGALPTLYKAYISVLPTLGGYINEGGTLNLERFKKYMLKLSAFDVEQFREAYADLKYFQAKTGRRLGAKERHSYRNSEDKECDDIADLKPVKNAELAALIQSTESDLLPSDEDDSEEIDGMESCDTDDEDDALFYLEFHQHKRDYYMKKLEYDTVNSEVLRSQADGYVRAIQWNLHYYYDGVCSWSWFYPHHYAPYISDICKFSDDLELNFDLGTPFLPFEQLLAVLPAASKKLLPEPYQQLMVEKESPIFHYYPSDFKTDLNGKKQEWEAVVLIPFIDEVSLLDAMAPCAALLTEEERNRNSHGPMHIYTYTEENLGVYEAPQHFPQIKINHAAAQRVSRNDIHMERSHLVKGLCPGVRLDVYFPGFPTLKHLAYTARFSKNKVKVFEQPSQGTNMILHITDQGKPDIKEVATELLGRTIFVSWPHLVEARVVAVSNREFRYGLIEDGNSGGTIRFNIEEVKGTSSAQWNMQCRGIQDYYANRMGVNIGDTSILVFATPITGRKYIFGLTGKITLEKQWLDTPVAYALQTTVRDIAVHDRTFQQFRTLQEVFPPKSICFMLGHPHYGAMGEVVDGGNLVKSGRVKVNMSATPEPNLDGIRKQHHDTIVQYMPGNVAAQWLGVSSHLVSRVTGTIYIVQGDKNASADSCSKVNVGLNLKFNKRNEEIPGYTRKDGSVWQYSNKAVELVRNYMQKFPELFDYLARHTGNDVFYEVDVFPASNGCVIDIMNWLKEQPYTQIERHVCGSEIVEAELVQSVEKEVDEFQQLSCRVKTVTMQVKPYLLYKPGIQMGNIAPDPQAVHRLFDRIVNVRESYTVPLGLKGTIIGIHRSDNDADLMYDVVFDKPFPGGLALNCSAGRGYRLPKPAMMNLSHGQRVELVKTVNKPTAVVQPSENAVIQDSHPVAPWNQGHTSAFASWNKNHQVVSSNFAATQFYRALQQPQQRIPQHVTNSAPPQPAFSLLGNRQPTSMRKQKQNYPSPAVPIPAVHSPAVSSPAVSSSASGSAPTEFQAMWTQLQKKTSPLKPNHPIPSEPVSTPDVARDTGTEYLKKMLRISDDSSEPVVQHPPPGRLNLENIHEHVPIKTPNSPKDGSAASSATVQLLHIFQQKAFGIPRYNYLNNMDDGNVQARVLLGGVEFCGKFCNNREQASESVARGILEELFPEQVPPPPPPPPQRNNSMSKPGTNTLPIPPQQWYQQHRHQHIQQLQHFPAQNFHHGRQDVIPEWRRRDASAEMIAAGGSPSSRSFKPPPQPFLVHQFQHNQQQQLQQQNWRGPGMGGNSSNRKQGYQQQPQRQQEGLRLWRQEDAQKQFVPLQAVRQQRNKPRQQSAQQNQTPSSEQKTDTTKNPGPDITAELANNLTLKTDTGSNKLSPAGRPNSVSAKPFVSRPRKSRLAANFNLNVQKSQ